MAFGSSPRETGAPWQYWPAAFIAAVTGAPVAAVQENWPLVDAQLRARGQGSKNSLAGAIGTIAIETGSTFRPVAEAYWLDEETRWAWYRNTVDHAPYSGGAIYYGRGYIQLTHDYNYIWYGDSLGVDLVNNPDRALEPAIAAPIFALYWSDHDIQSMADRGDWTAVRRAVQGGTASLSRLISIATALLA